MSSVVRFTLNGVEYSLDEVLAYQLDSICYNLKKDWDFVILITGDRMVRVGKSELAAQIVAYLTWSLGKLKVEGQIMNANAFETTTMNNLFFDNKEMMAESQKRDKYNVIWYDEAREGLSATKAMSQFQKDIIDFFNECGQLNHIFVVVCPDYFDMKEDIAVARSELLINVYRKEVKKMMDIYKDGIKRPITVLQRGHFELFSRKTKQYLYDVVKSTRRKSYGHVKADHVGDYGHYFPFDEVKYRELKRLALSRFDERHKKQETPKDNKLRNQIILNLRESGMIYKAIKAELWHKYGIELSVNGIREIIHNILANKSDENNEKEPILGAIVPNV